MSLRFRNRIEAGRTLAGHLTAYAGRNDVLVLGLPRGGVPVAAEVARRLAAPLDVFVVRKLGVPGHPEFAMGALASGGIRLVDPKVVRDLGVTDEEIERATAVELRELARRERTYRAGREFPELGDRIVIIVDDGLATGSTMQAAIAALREKRPRKIVVAAPVAAAETCAKLGPLVDQIVCVRTPDPFLAVGLWYEDFSETTDAEIHEILATAGSPTAAGTMQGELR